MIEAAARHLWGVECRVSHTFTVSLQAGCSEQTTYSCIVYKKLGDMLGVLVSLGPAQVEKARSCIALSKQSYPGSCIFSDILHLVKNPPKSKSWNPSQLQLKKHGFCQQHKTECLD